MNELSTEKKTEDLSSKKAFWVMVAMYYQKTLEDMTVKMYAQDCIGADVQAMKRAFEKHRLSQQGHFMPMPNQILELVRYERSEQESLNEMRRISEAQEANENRLKMLESGKANEQ